MGRGSTWNRWHPILCCGKVAQATYMHTSCMHGTAPDPGLVWPASGRPQPCSELAAGARCLHLHAAAPALPALWLSVAASGCLQRQSSKSSDISQLHDLTNCYVEEATQIVHVQFCNCKEYENFLLQDKYLPVSLHSLTLTFGRQQFTLHSLQLLLSSTQCRSRVSSFSLSF